MPGDTNHLKSGTYCFLGKHSALKGQSMEQFASCYKWKCRVLGPSPGSVKDPTSLKELGLCGSLSGCESYHHVGLHHIMRCHLVAKSATRPNKASNMACHNGQNVAVRSTTNNKYKVFALPSWYACVTQVDDLTRQTDICHSKD